MKCVSACALANCFPFVTPRNFPKKKTGISLQVFSIHIGGKLQRSARGNLRRMRENFGSPGNGTFLRDTLGRIACIASWQQ